MGLHINCKPGHIAQSVECLIQEPEVKVLVNCLNLHRKSVGRLTDCTDMTLDVYSGRKTTTQQHTL